MQTVEILTQICTPFADKYGPRIPCIERPGSLRARHCYFISQFLLFQSLYAFQILGSVRALFVLLTHVCAAEGTNKQPSSVLKHRVKHSSTVANH